MYGENIKTRIIYNNTKISIGNSYNYLVQFLPPKLCRWWEAGVLYGENIKTRIIYNNTKISIGNSYNYLVQFLIQWLRLIKRMCPLIA